MNPLIAREYIEGALKIRSKSGQIVPFRLNRAQESSMPWPCASSRRESRCASLY